MTTRPQELEGKFEIDYTRQRDWFDPSKSQAKVTIAGCGGIGSPTAVFLSKLGIPKLTLVDDDVIEPHNVPNQFYPLKLVGKDKVVVLKAMCEMFGSSEVKTHKKKIQQVPEVLNGIVVTGFDNMQARQDTWELIDPSRVSYVIDGRISGLNMQIYTIDPSNEEQREMYEQFGLFTQEEVVEAPCTARAMIDVMAFIAGHITRLVRMIATDQVPDPVISFETDKLGLWLPYKDA